MDFVNEIGPGGPKLICHLNTANTMKPLVFHLKNEKTLLDQRPNPHDCKMGGVKVKNCKNCSFQPKTVVFDAFWAELRSESAKTMVFGQKTWFLWILYGF